MKYLPSLVVLATLVAGPAFADCTNPTGVGGAIVWNSDYSIVQVCNGTNWVGLGGNGNNGAGEVDPQVGAVTDGKWCTASGGVVTCTSDAPLASVALDDLTDATITSAATGNVLHYNGSGWVNTPITSLVSSSSALGDRITSGTTSIVAQSGGVISITTNGSTANYWDTAGRLVTPGISVTTLNGISSTNGQFSGRVIIRNQNDANYTLMMYDAAGELEHSFEPAKVLLVRDGGSVGVGTNSPQAKVDISGNVRATSSAADCTSSNLGAMRFNPVTKRPEICRMPDS